MAATVIHKNSPAKQITIDSYLNGTPLAQKPLLSHLNRLKEKPAIGQVQRLLLFFQDKAERARIKKAPISR